MGLEALFIFVFYGGIIVIVLFVLWLQRFLENNRSDALEQIAKKMSWSFSKNGELNESDFRFKLFSQGHSKKVMNVMTGDYNGINWEVFGYQYTIGYGKGSHTHKQTIAYADLPKEKVTPFRLTKENLFQKMGLSFNDKDIDFKNHPEFSNRYYLEGAHEDEIRKLFTPKLIKLFENFLSDFSVETTEDSIVIYMPDIRTNPENIDLFLDEATMIIKELIGKKTSNSQKKIDEFEERQRSYGLEKEVVLRGFMGSKSILDIDDENVGAIGYETAGKIIEDDIYEDEIGEEQEDIEKKTAEYEEEIEEIDEEVKREEKSFGENPEPTKITYPSQNRSTFKFQSDKSKSKIVYPSQRKSSFKFQSEGENSSIVYPSQKGKKKKKGDWF